MSDKEHINATAEFDYHRSLKRSGHEMINRFIRVERYINRPLASLLVRSLYRTRITPNQLTYLSFFLALAGAFLFTRGQYIYFIFAGVITQLSAVMDCADGMLARSKDRCSDYGAHLDLFLDRIGDFFLVSCISLGQYLYSGSLVILVVGLFAAVLYFLQINLHYIINSFSGNQERGGTGEARALLLLAIFLMSLVNRLDILVYALLAGVVLSTLYKIFRFLRLGQKQG